MVVSTGSGDGYYWVEVREAAKHPTVHRMAPQQKDYPAPNVNCVMTEKHRSRFWAYSSEQNNKKLICLLCIDKIYVMYIHKYMYFTDLVLFA